MLPIVRRLAKIWFPKVAVYYQRMHAQGHCSDTTTMTQILYPTTLHIATVSSRLSQYLLPNPVLLNSGIRNHATPYNLPPSPDHPWAVTPPMTPPPVAKTPTRTFILLQSESPMLLQKDTLHLHDSNRPRNQSNCAWRPPTHPARGQSGSHQRRASPLLMYPVWCPMANRMPQSLPIWLQDERNGDKR